MKCKNIAVSLLVFICTIYLCISFESVSLCVQNAVRLCCTNVVPALFPFFILSDIFMQSIAGARIPKPVADIYRKLFRVDVCTLPVFISGIISGYPVGAAATYSMYKSGRISRADAERLICFTNNSGPLFVISAVGCGMFGNIRCGIVLYIIHIIAAIVTGISLPGRYTESRFTEPQSAQTNISVTEIIEAAFMKCIKICGFVIIFAVVNSCISHSIPHRGIGTIIGCITEITGGISALSVTYPLEVALPLASFALGWSGISVLLQVKSVTHGELSTRKYIFSKLGNGIISALLSHIHLQICNTDVPGSVTQSKTAEILIVIAFIIILAYLYKRSRNAAGKQKIKSTV